MAGGDETRPSVLSNATETQISELDQQYREGDRSAWDTLVESYGWSREDGDAVWEWYGADSNPNGMSSGKQ